MAKFKIPDEVDKRSRMLAIRDAATRLLTALTSPAEAMA